MNSVKLDSVQCVKELDVSIVLNHKFSQQCKVNAAGKASRMPGFINRNFSFENKSIIPPLYISLVRSNLKYAVQFWSPHHTKDIDKLAFQRRVTNMISSLRHKSYEERLVSLHLFSLKKQWLRGKQIKFFKTFKGFTNVDASKLFSVDDTSRTRSNGVKLRCKQVQLDSTKFFVLTTWLGSGIRFHLQWYSVIR